MTEALTTESLQEQALAAYAELLNGLPGERYWGGGWPRAVRCERVFQPAATVTDMPHLILLESGGEMTRDAVKGAAVRFRDDFEVELIGYAAREPGVTASRQIGRLWRDCLKTTMEGFSMGGIVSAVTPGRRQFMTSETGAWAEFSQIFILTIYDEILVRP